MANSNRVFVSPGVYTSEKDLTFVAQSVGVTTLGLVGETLKGPAFEPILVGDFDEFKTYFGPTSPEKDGANNPKYELAYMAKSYLQESNQLFVTRILGKTGYKPGKTYSIKTLGGVNLGSLSGSTTGITLSATTATITGSTIYGELSGKTATDGSTVTDYVINKIGKSGASYANNDWFVIGDVPASDTTSLTGTQLLSPIGENTNKNWYNAFFTKTGSTDATIDGVYAYLFVYSTGSSSFTVTRYKYNASLNTDYSDVIVTSLMSRGVYNATQTLLLQVTGTTAVTLTDVGGIESNPMAEFDINVTDITGGTKTLNCS
jgi:hypothetical protein